jgi:hypothetical protein
MNQPLFNYAGPFVTNSTYDTLSRAIRANNKLVGEFSIIRASLDHNQLWMIDEIVSGIQFTISQLEELLKMEKNKELQQ